MKYINFKIIFLFILILNNSINGYSQVGFFMEKKLPLKGKVKSIEQKDKLFGESSYEFTENSTIISYNKDGKLHSIFKSDFNNDTIEYHINKYDKNGNVIEEKSKDVGVWMNRYNAQNLLETEIFFYGTITSLKNATCDSKIVNRYNKKKQVIEKDEYVYQDSTTLDFTYFYTYDEKGNLIKSDKQKEGVSFELSTYEYKYDSKGNIIEEVSTNSERPEKNYTKKIKYDNNGDWIDIIVTNGANEFVFHYTSEYDKQGSCIAYSELDEKSSVLWNRTYKFEYDKIGNWISEEAFKSGVKLYNSTRTITYQ